MGARDEQVRARATVTMGEEAFGELSGTALWWLTNAGFLINSHGTRLMIDPAISLAEGGDGAHETGHRLLVPLPIRAQDVPGLEAVLYTHGDYDHFAPTSARALAVSSVTFVPHTILANTGI